MTQKKRGFAAMKPAERKAAARKGGQTAQAKKTGGAMTDAKRETHRSGAPTAEMTAERKTSGRRMATAENAELEREFEE